MVKVKSLEIREITYTYETRPRIHSPEDVSNIVKPLISDPNKEHFITLYLNTKNGILIQEITSIGSLNANIVHPREVFRTACKVSAAHIIVAHNHPSGDPTPSTEDIELTKKLVEAGKLLGIDVLDHIIIGYDRNYTFRESGAI